MSLVLYDSAEGIATVTLNHPGKLNALVGSMREELPIPIRDIKNPVYASMIRDLATQRELENQNQLRASADAREGMTAFLEKRPPRFRGSDSSVNLNAGQYVGDHWGS